MSKEKEYLQDLAQIRTMMERSSKFLSLSGWAGILAGTYALVGMGLAYTLLNVRPENLRPLRTNTTPPFNVEHTILLALAILLLAVGTAIWLSHQKAKKRGERAWNPIAKRMLINMGVPLAVGGCLLLVLLAKGWIAFLMPVSLIFYGLALFNAGNFTYATVKLLGVAHILLGLVSVLALQYAWLCWGFGFGILHIGYGSYMHYTYDR